MLALAVVFLLGGIFVQVAFSDDPVGGSLLGVLFASVGALFMYLAGNGHLAFSLNEGDVREVICSAPTTIGSEALFGALLRKPEGELEAVLLKKEPPKHFVVIGNPSDPYAPYPGK